MISIFWSKKALEIYFKENLQNTVRSKLCAHFAVKWINVISRSTFVRFFLIFQKIGRTVHVFLKRNQYLTYVVIRKLTKTFKITIWKRFIMVEAKKKGHAMVLTAEERDKKFRETLWHLVAQSGRSERQICQQLGPKQRIYKQAAQRQSRSVLQGDPGTGWVL